jgi:hypothetical protein
LKSPCCSIIILLQHADDVVEALFDRVIANCKTLFDAITAATGNLAGRLKRAALAGFRVLVFLWTEYHDADIRRGLCLRYAPQYFEWIERVQEWIGRVVQAAPGPCKRKKIDIAATSGPLPDNLDPDCLVLLKAVGIACQNDWDAFVNDASPVELERLSAFLGDKYHVTVELLNGIFFRIHFAGCVLLHSYTGCVCVQDTSPPWWLRNTATSFSYLGPKGFDLVETILR